MSNITFSTRLFIGLVLCFLAGFAMTGCEEDFAGPDPVDFQDASNARDSFNLYVGNMPTESIAPILYGTTPQVLDQDSVVDGNLVCQITEMAASAENQDFLLYHNDDIWVGAPMVNEGLTNGGFNPLLGGLLAPQEISFSGPVADQVVWDIDEPSLGSYTNVINQFRQQDLIRNADLTASFKIYDVYSMDQLQLEMGASLKLGLWGEISASIDQNRLDEYTYYVVEIKQKHLSVNLSLPSEPADLYTVVPGLSNLGSWSPVVCSSITYGRAAYFVLRTTYSRDESRLAVDGAFRFFGTLKLDVEIEQEVVNVLNEMRITGLILGGEQGPGLGTINGVDGIREYLETGFVNNESFGVPLSFKFRFLKDFSIAKTVSNVQYNVRTGCQELPEVAVVTVDGDSLDFGKLIPKNTGPGDREFGGDGPDVNSELQLLISPDGRELRLSVYATFSEYDADYTTGTIEELFTVLTLDEGYVIDEIISPSQELYSFRDEGHNDLHITPPSPNTLVYSYEILGDTGGSDIPDINNPDPQPGDYSYFSCTFNDVLIRIREE